MVASGPGVYTLPLREFGGWLRLCGQVRGQQASFRVIIYLVLKG